MRNLSLLDGQIAEIRSYLSSNKNKLAINLISRLELSEIPFEQRLELAQLARLAGIPMTGIRILSHVLKEDRTASPEEIIEYCGCLNDLGAVEECIRRLSARTESWPVAATFEAGKAYLKIYHFVVARELLEKVLEKASDDLLLNRNCRKLLCYCYRMLGEFGRATQVLQGIPDAAFEIKLVSTAQEAFSVASGESVAELSKLREEALQVRAGELQREIEFYIAYATQDASLKQRLFFGTPSEYFRDRMRQANTQELELPEFYSLGIPSTVASTRVFELFKGKEVGNPEVKLKIGQVLHRLYVTLLGDFYGTISISRLHEKVFQGDSFDPETSPSRVHQIVKRLKHWLIKQQVPLSVEEQSGTYRMRFHDAYLVKISKEHLALPQENPLYVRLELALPGNDFSIKDAAQALGLSRRFARKILERAEHEGWVLMKGRGRTTRYEFHRKNQIPL